MIIRQSVLRLGQSWLSIHMHDTLLTVDSSGRRALTSPVTQRPWRPYCRTMATDVDSLSTVVDHANLEIGSIESTINRTTGEPVLPFDEDAPDHDGQMVADMFHTLQQQSTFRSESLSRSITPVDHIS